MIAVLSGCVVAAEVLARRPGLRLIGTALIVITVTAIVANLGVIPTSGGEHPVYAFLFREGAWMAIFLLLLRVNLRSVLSAGAGAIGLFALGAAGTAAGALVATWLLGGAGAPASITPWPACSPRRTSAAAPTSWPWPAITR